MRVPSRVASALSYFGREALRIVLPSWCVACGKELEWDARVASCCRACWNALPKITMAKCVSCALPLPTNSVCIECMENPLPVDWCEAWGTYRDSLEKVLHALKFEKHDFLDDTLAGLLEETLRDRDFDVILGVPMSAAKERRRGYNQAELLARALGRRIDVPCDMLLTRRREKAAQSLLPKHARAANVRGAFQASPNSKGKSILIVDDICTTGETLRACANALVRAGASRVCAVTVAKTV